MSLASNKHHFLFSLLGNLHCVNKYKFSFYFEIRTKELNKKYLEDVLRLLLVVNDDPFKTNMVNVLKLLEM